MGIRAILASMVALLAFVPASEAAPAFPYPGSAWTWGTPRPQGKDLSSVDFHGPSGIAFADGDTLVSGNGGQTFSPAGPSALTSTARFLPNGSIVGGGANCTLVRSDDGGRTFRALALGPNPKRFTIPAGGPCTPADFSFPTPDVGYVQRSDVLLRTTDGGASFIRRTPMTGSLTFVGPDTGFALSAYGIARTTDGAQTWTPVASSTTELNGLTFTDPAHGYATGESGTLLRSDDGGITWNRRQVPGYEGTFRGMRCASPIACLAVYQAPPTSDDDTRLVRIEDGGATVRAVPGLAGVRAVAYASGQRAAAVGDSGLMAYSDDAGRSFRETSEGSHDYYFKVFRGPGRTLFAGGAGVGRSDSGGRTWRRLGSPDEADLSVEDLSFGDRRHGAALLTDSVDVDYALWTTSNGGASWQRRRHKRGGPAPSGVVALAHGRVITDLGRRGVWLSRDSGRRFQRVAAPAVRGLHVYGYARRGPVAAVFGDRTLALTRDGASWRRVPLPRGAEPTLVEVVSRRVIIVRGNSGTLWRTETGGRHWRELHGLGAFGVVSMSFADARHGMALGASSALHRDDSETSLPLRTDDGGRTWRPQFDDFHEHGSVVALDRSRTVLAGPGVLWSARGGDPPQRRAIRLAISSRRGNVVRVRGRLTRPRASERILISRVDGRHQRARLVPVGGDGRFGLKLRLRRSAWLVAQAVGDETGSGAGSRPIHVRVAR